MIRSSVKRMEPLRDVGSPPNHNTGSRPASPAKFDLTGSSSSNGSPPDSIEGSPTTGSPSPLAFSDYPGINRSERAVSTESIDSVGMYFFSTYKKKFNLKKYFIYFFLRRGTRGYSFRNAGRVFVT
jgi:hypothetical protein